MKVKIFYLTAFLYSWIIWGIAIIINPALISANALISIGGAGTIIAVAVTFIFAASPTDKRNYLRRLYSFSGFSPLIFAAILIPFAVQLISSGFQPELNPSLRDNGWFYPFFLFLFGPLPEEMAWRGIAFDELTKKSYLKAQFIVAVLWGAWHLPMFFIPGSYQAELGLFSFDFWMFFISIIPVSFICGWIYLKSGRSIISAVLFYYFINLSGEIFTLTGQQMIISSVIYAVIAVYCLISRPVSAE